MTDTFEDDFHSQRVSKILALQKENSVYPHKFQYTHTVKQISAIPDENHPFVIHSCGRIMAIRKMGKMNFYKVTDNAVTIQLVIKKDHPSTNQAPSIISTKKPVHYESADFNDATDFFKRGDIVGFTGTVGRTRTGELSIFADSITLLTPCLRTLPVEHFGIRDPELIYRTRYLDLIVNNDSRNRFVTRSKVISYIREFLNKREFLEVETPMMNLIPGGAAAKPFMTYHNELKQNFFLRISPELYLKQLVIGGLNRVYELGKDFRNEGIDLTHNPEFTTCEFYMAYANYEDLIEMTEEMLSGVVKSIYNGYKVNHWPMKREERPDPVELDFSRPFKRICIVTELNERIQEKMNLWSCDDSSSKYTNREFIGKFELRGDNLEELLDFLVFFMKKENLKLNEPHTLPRILDKLIGEYIEPQCISPTFVMHHPLVMSPLAKKCSFDEFITERFELFINGKEICNAYTELNDPFDQKARFEDQVAQSEAGDDEAMKMDRGFITALEYGLPPTAGWGIGIDRFVMFLTNAANIRDVLFFPAMKPEEVKKPKDQ